jgi:hypothetical protein
MSDDGFESFWNAYPRHDAKERAIKAWAAIAPSFEVQIAIHAALKWQVLEWKDPKFTPMAKTYLRGERWMDEPRPTCAASTGWTSYRNGSSGCSISVPSARRLASAVAIIR